MGFRTQPSTSQPDDLLTRRERDILAWMARGLTGPEIAERLSLAPSAVKWYASQIYRKLGVSSRRRALARARELGLLHLESPAPLPAGAPYPRLGQPLPTGTVTFLFTDIQGSTPLWERAPEKMAAALQIHHAALRQAIAAQGGFVFKTIGDAFQCAFATAPQALKAAIAGQQALRSAPWNELGPLQVRMGLHTGEAEPDPGGDEYAVSHTKNRAARIMSIAHGGQILISQETADLVDHQLPAEVSLKDLGEHRLKGMAILEHLYQVWAPGLSQEFPPLPTAVAYPNNLPIQLTSFIGRENETAVVKRLLQEHRLVTLTGSGGTGKTRLSLQVAGETLEQYPNGAWLVELAPLADPALVPQAVAAGLKLPETPGKPVLDSLVDFLRHKRLLLVLDNCEHLLDACTRLADHLLHACPGISILASSREFLGVEGEAPYRVPPMALPDPRRLPPLAQLSEYDAVHLFTERARVVSPGFTLTESTAAAVTQIVTRLDGIPLAIELAASRLRLLSVEGIAARLDDAFRLLTGGSRTALPRHQTLRALIDWSYHLLSKPERILLRRLSVFAGGWSLEAAEKICGNTWEDWKVERLEEEGQASFQPLQQAAQASSNLQSEMILDLLSLLVDKSLIQPFDVASGESRFTMLETVRQYSHEKLVDEGEATAIRTRHLSYYLVLAEVLEPKIRSREQIQTLDRLELELDNLRLALEWALQTDLEAELRLAAALQWYWHIRAHWSEGVDWLERGLAAEMKLRTSASDMSVQATIRAKALTALGFHYKMQYGYGQDQQAILDRSDTALEESLSIYRASDLANSPENRRGLAWALQWRAMMDEKDPVRSLEMVQEAHRIFRETSDAHGMAESLAVLSGFETDHDTILKFHLEQLAVDEANGDVEGMGSAHWLIGLHEYRYGNFQKARQSCEASQRYFRQVNNPNMVAWLWWGIGLSSLCCGDLAHARLSFNQSLASYLELGNERQIAFCLYFKGLLAVAEGEYDQAEELSDQVWRIAQKPGLQSFKGNAGYLRVRLARVQGEFALAQKQVDEIQNDPDIEEDQKMLAWSELGYLALDKGDIRRAGSICREVIQVLDSANYNRLLDWQMDLIAVLARRAGKMERAGRLFGTRWSRAAYHFLSPTEKQQRRADLDTVRAVLGEKSFEKLYEEGRVMTLKQAVAYAGEEHE